MEAQGRGSLHPHILVWLVLLSLQELHNRLLRDRATFRERVRRWMHEVVHAVLSVQQTPSQAWTRAWLIQPGVEQGAFPFSGVGS